MEFLPKESFGKPREILRQSPYRESITDPKTILKESLKFARFYKGFAQNDPKRIPARFARREFLGASDSGTSDSGASCRLIRSEGEDQEDILVPKRYTSYKEPHVGKILVPKKYTSYKAPPIVLVLPPPLAERMCSTPRELQIPSSKIQRVWE